MTRGCTYIGIRKWISHLRCQNVCGGSIRMASLIIIICKRIETAATDDYVTVRGETEQIFRDSSDEVAWWIWWRVQHWPLRVTLKRCIIHILYYSISKERLLWYHGNMFLRMVTRSCHRRAACYYIILILYIILCCSG